MRLIITYISLFTLFQCGTKNNNNDGSLILYSIYQNLPKKTPIPNLDKDGNIISGTSKYIHFKYAVNNNFVNYTTSSKSFICFNKEYNINSFQEIPSNSSFKKFKEQSVIISNKQFLDKKEKKELGVDGVISFSKPMFDEKKLKALVFVGVYRSGLDSSLDLYFLEKINNKWIVKCIINKEIS